MKREYNHIKGMENEILRMRAEGKTRQEIVDTSGLKKSQIKNWINRHNKVKEATLPKRRGRARKRAYTEPQAMALRIKELEREVELLRSFLHAAGRM